MAISGTCTTVNLHARQVISGNQWYLHDGELADALDRHRLFEGGGVESEELGSVVEAGLCSAAHLISMQSSRSSAASGFAIRMQSACSAAYGAAVILLSELRGLEGQVADVQYLWGKGAVVSTCMLSEHADRRCAVPVGKGRRGEHMHAERARGSAMSS